MARTSVPVRRRSKQHSPTGLLLIGLFKFAKGLLLVAVGAGVLKLLHKDAAEAVTRWVQILRVDPDNRFIHSIIVRFLSVTPKQLKEIGAGTFFYAGLLLTEGAGLLLRKHWAEYFTIITTAALIPLELYEIARRFTAVKVAFLAINVAIVWYLVAKVRGARRR